MTRRALVAAIVGIGLFATGCTTNEPSDDGPAAVQEASAPNTEPTSYHGEPDPGDTGAGSEEPSDGSPPIVAFGETATFPDGVALGIESTTATVITDELIQEEIDTYGSSTYEVGYTIWAFTLRLSNGSDQPIDVGAPTARVYLDDGSEADQDATDTGDIGGVIPAGAERTGERAFILPSDATTAQLDYAVTMDYAVTFVGELPKG